MGRDTVVTGSSAGTQVRPTVEVPLVRSTRQAVAGLTGYAVTLFLFPSDMVLRVVGGQGFVAGLVALVLLGGWISWVLLGGHDPRLVRHPTRGALVALVAVSLVCWALTPFHGLSATEQLSADRWVMLLAQTAGVVLVAAEGLTSVDALLKVLRWLVRGAAFCALVAVLQWLFTIDLSGVIRQSLPGFGVSTDYTVYTSRGALQRVSGTAIHPIELGVVAAMALPIAVVVAMVDTHRRRLARWSPVGLILLAIPASVSRSAVLAVVISMAVLIACLPGRSRLAAVVVAPVVAFLVVLARPGYLTTLAGLVGAGSDDASVATRLEDYPLVERLVSEHPWFGFGGGSFIATNALEILDNQLLKSAIELGLVGVTVLVAWFLVPVVTALVSRRRSTDPRLRLMAASLAGSAAAAAAASLTFDSLSFNMFAGLHALVVGCCGACWLLSDRSRVGAVPADDQHPGES